MNEDRQQRIVARPIRLERGDHDVKALPGRVGEALRFEGTVAGLPAEDIVVLASGTPWQVPWELMMNGPFVSCGLLDDTVVRHITVSAMVASATLRPSAPESILTPSDYPPMPLFGSTTSLLEAAALVVETGWDLAVVMDDEPRVISARSVYRALIGTRTPRQKEEHSMASRTPALTDTEVQLAVEQELNWDPAIAQASIGVSVTDHTITLSGTVHSYGSRLAAIGAARRVKGVRALADDIVVEPNGTAGRTDHDIADNADQVLKWSVSVPETVRIAVRDGLLTLEGNADWDFERRAAQRAVQYITGVRSVINNIELTRRAAAGNVHDLISTALHRSADIDASNIHVASDNGHVTLSGSVSSWAERERAQHTAWSATGVCQVENDLDVH